MMGTIVPRQFHWFKNQASSLSHIMIFLVIHYEYIQATIVILRMLLVSLFFFLICAKPCFLLLENLNLTTPTGHFA